MKAFSSFKIGMSLLTILPLLINHSFAQKNEPNILWVVIEDTSPQNIGCYGNTAVNTPQIDQLAKEGVRFTNAYSTGTVCSPSRSALITGVKTYNMGTGNHRSNVAIPDYITGFPAYLKQAGYYTTNHSKTDYNTANADKIILDSWNESSNRAGWWNRKPGQPFFAVFNFGDSHQSRTMTNPYELYQKQVLSFLPESLKVGDNDFKMPPFYKDSPDMRKQMARVYNGISLADYKIGKVLERLEKEGLKDSTIIFFYSDHGQGMPRGKTNGIGQGYKIPFVVWFPEMYKHLSPWGTKGVVTDEQVSFVDFAPTILSLAGVNIPGYIDGRAFMGPKREEAKEYMFTSNDRGDDSPNLDRSVIKKNLIYTRNFTAYSASFRWMHYFMYGTISQIIVKDYNAGLLSKEQAMLMKPREAESLYDLSVDPWEMNNLIGDPHYKNETAKMRKALEKNILDSKDIMFAAEYEFKRLPEGTTPYEFRLSNEYNIKNIWKAASLAGIRSKASREEQIKLLSHPDRLVRYWAAIGLKSQLSFNKKDLVNMLRHLQDKYPPVKIYLASVVYDINKNKEAKTILEEYALSDDSDLSLMALHNIHNMHYKQDFLQLATEVYNSTKNKRGMGLSRNSAEVLLYRLENRPLEMDRFW